MKRDCVVFTADGFEANFIQFMRRRVIVAFVQAYISFSIWRRVSVFRSYVDDTGFELKT